MKKGRTLYLMLSINHPTAKLNHLKTFSGPFLIKTKTLIKIIILQGISILTSYTMMNSLQTGIFPDKLKIARVTLLFKGGKSYELGN